MLMRRVCLLSLLNENQKKTYRKEKSDKVNNNMKFVSVLVAAVVLFFGVVDYFIVEDKVVYAELNQLRIGFLLLFIFPLGIFFFKNKKETPQFVMVLNALGYGLYLFGLSMVVGNDVQAVFHNIVGIFMLNISLYIILGLRRLMAVGLSMFFVVLVYFSFLRLGSHLSSGITIADLVLWFGISTVLGVAFNFYMENIQVKSFLARWNLNELNESRYKMFSMVSHDLKNIIASQSTISDFLQHTYEKIGKDELKHMLYLLNKSSNDANDLFEDLMVWIKAQLELIKPVLSLLDMKGFINEQVEQFKVLAESKNVTLDKSGIMVDEIKSDEVILGLVFRNIVSNAIKYSNKNSVVKIAANKVAHGLQISVSDSGHGMTSEQLKSVLQWDGVKSSLGTGSEKGSGIGLMLSKDLLRFINGSIKIESTEGKGTSVSINVPEFDFRAN